MATVLDKLSEFLGLLSRRGYDQLSAISMGYSMGRTKFIGKPVAAHAVPGLE
jgi:hypothetical protein